MQAYMSFANRRTVRVLLAVLVVLLAGLLLTGCSEDDAQRLASGDAPDAEAEIRELLESEEYGLAADVLQGVRIVGGLVLLVAGWKLYRLMVILPGLIIGGLIGMGLGATESELYAMLGLLLGAALGGYLALMVHVVAIFLAGGAIVAALVASAANTVDPVTLVVAGLVGGAIMLALYYWLIVFVTAAIGAAAFGTGVGLGPAIIVGLAILGAFVQFGVAKALGESVFDNVPFREKGKPKPGPGKLKRSRPRPRRQLPGYPPPPPPHPYAPQHGRPQPPPRRPSTPPPPAPQRGQSQPPPRRPSTPPPGTSDRTVPHLPAAPSEPPPVPGSEARTLTDQPGAPDSAPPVDSEAPTQLFDAPPDEDD